MNIITFTDICRPDYPIGENINTALNYINAVTPFIKKLVGDKRINIWCSGSSGAILAAFLIKNLDNNDCFICHVKKEGENAHHGNSFYRAYDNEAINMILDDFMRSGNTIERIYKQMNERDLKVDILVLANCYKQAWKLSFKPLNLIIDKNSVQDSWSE